VRRALVEREREIGRARTNRSVAFDPRLLSYGRTTRAVIAPLRLPTGTRSPANPITII
jgi:hypothetical protein